VKRFNPAQRAPGLVVAAVRAPVALCPPGTRGSPTGQVAVLGIALQQALPIQILANALCDALRQFGQLGARGRLDPAEANCADYVCTAVADASDQSSEAVAAQTVDNARRLFDLP